MTRARGRSRWLALGAGLAVGFAVVVLVAHSWSVPAPDVEPKVSSHALAGDPDGALELAGGARDPRPTATSEPASPRAAQAQLPTRLLTGRVLGPEGEPATRAAVTASVHGEGAPRLDPAPAWWRPDTRTDAEGRFGILVMHGARVTVHVATEEARPFKGTFEIAQEVDADVGDLRLEAGAALEGRVTVGGRPSAIGPPMLRVAPERRSRRNSTPRPLGARIVDLTTPDGARLLWHDVRSDAVGRWRLTGLVPEAYVVTVIGVDGELFQDALVSRPSLRTPAPASGVDLDLDVCLVRVVAPARIAFVGTFWIEVRGPDGRQVRVEQPPTVVVEMGRPPPDQRACEFFASSQTELEVRAQFEGQRGWSTRTRTPAAGAVVTLVAEPEIVPIGVVRLVAPPSAPQRLVRLTYEAYEPGTSHLVARGSLMIGLGEPPEIRLHVGSHDMRVRDPQDRWLLEQRSTVDVTAGAPVDLLWAPAKGARVRAYVARGPKEPIRVHLVRAGSEDVLLGFEPTAASGFPLVEESDALVAGAEFQQLSPALAPGAVRLRFETAGFAPYEAPVTLVAGEIADVRVELKPSTPR